MSTDPEFRIEHDTMGEVRVPASALYGAQTQRAVENFPVSGVPLPPRFVHALGLVKLAAARVNRDLGLLEPRIADAIEGGAMVTTGEQVTARDFLAGLPVLGESELYDDVCERLDATNDGQRAGAIELALEGLYLARKVGKDSDGSETVYG